MNTQYNVGYRTKLRNYDCDSCGAVAGEHCKTKDGKQTQPHQFRWEKHAEFLRRYVSEKLGARPMTVLLTVTALTRALEPEGWGSGFSKALAERVMIRLKDDTAVAHDPGHTHLGSSDAVKGTSGRLCGKV